MCAWAALCDVDGASGPGAWLQAGECRARALWEGGGKLDDCSRHRAGHHGVRVEGCRAGGFVGTLRGTQVVGLPDALARALAVPVLGDQVVA